MTETYKDRLDRMHSVRALDRDVQSARVAFADAAIAIRDTGEGELPQDVVATGQLQGELERIAAGLSRRPGLTSRELAVAINEDRYMVAKRMSVLEARGVAKRGEIRECSESGKRAITWWPVAGGGVVSERIYILFDERAMGGKGTDDANVVEACNGLNDARRRARRSGVSCACYSYADDMGLLIDRRWEFDYDSQGGGK